MNTTEKPGVGFIGLGLMGAAMASNLQKAGYALIVHDKRREAAAPPAQSSHKHRAGWTPGRYMRALSFSSP